MDKVIIYGNHFCLIIINYLERFTTSLCKHVYILHKLFHLLYLTAQCFEEKTLKVVALLPLIDGTNAKYSSSFLLDTEPRITNFAVYDRQ